MRTATTTISINSKMYKLNIFLDGILYEEKMGNKQSFLGGVEVPVTDQHPWGVNNGIKMMIPLEFANRMRKEGDPLNTEYKNFLAHRTYELVPYFINLFKQVPDFNKEYVTFLEKLINNHGVKVQVENLVKLARISNSTISILFSISQLRKLDPKNKEWQFQQMKLVYNAGIPILYKFPNYLDSEIGDIKYTENDRGAVTFTNNPYLLSFIYLRKLTERQMIDPNKFNNWEEYEQKRNKIMHVYPRPQDSPHYLDLDRRINQDDIKVSVSDTIYSNTILAEVNKRENCITVIPISLYYWDGGSHAITVIINSYSKTIYLTDSNGMNEYNAQIESFLRRDGKFSDYKVIAIMPPSSCPNAFQSISQDEFCQTWTFLISNLVILNGFDITQDINETVFNEIIDYAKPLVGYYEGMNPRSKLGLIIIEFMFYMYKTFRSWFELITGSLAKINEKLEIDIEQDDWEDALEQAEQDEEIKSLNPDDPQYSHKLYKKAEQYLIDEASGKIANAMKSYKYSDDVGMEIKKITENVNVNNYTSFELVKAIITGLI